MSEQNFFPKNFFGKLSKEARAGKDGSAFGQPEVAGKPSVRNAIFNALLAVGPGIQASSQAAAAGADPLIAGLAAAGAALQAPTAESIEQDRAVREAKARMAQFQAMPVGNASPGLVEKLRSLGINLDPNTPLGAVDAVSGPLSQFANIQSALAKTNDQFAALNDGEALEFARLVGIAGNTEKDTINRVQNIRPSLRKQMLESALIERRGQAGTGVIRRFDVLSAQGLKRALRAAQGVDQLRPEDSGFIDSLIGVEKVTARQMITNRFRRKNVSPVFAKILANTGVMVREGGRWVPMGETELRGLSVGEAREAVMLAKLDTKLVRVGNSLQAMVVNRGGQVIRTSRIGLDPTFATKYADALSEEGQGLRMLSQLEDIAFKVIRLDARKNTSTISGKLGGAIDRLKQKAEIEASALAGVPDAKVFKDSVNGFLSFLTRSLGERGVLTTQDVERIRATLPSGSDNRQTMALKFARLRNLFSGIRAERIQALSNLSARNPRKTRVEVKRMLEELSRDKNSEFFLDYGVIEAGANDSAIRENRQIDDIRNSGQFFDEQPIFAQQSPFAQSPNFQFSQGAIPQAPPGVSVPPETDFSGALDALRRADEMGAE